MKLVFNWKWVSISSGNGFVPTRQQAVTYTNTGKKIYDAIWRP